MYIYIYIYRKIFANYSATIGEVNNEATVLNRNHQSWNPEDNHR